MIVDGIVSWCGVCVGAVVVDSTRKGKVTNHTHITTTPHRKQYTHQSHQSSQTCGTHVPSLVMVIERAVPCVVLLMVCCVMCCVVCSPSRML